ncbi:hypothetical protein IQ279_13885 [Streptomyces verrucosisporus]|uniref:hypothetical protein n=1 Tax=Streptomyces verrucosisporus TaxID=1695161 RepID=UPI0019D1C177|nr:hypothetical protein [Streptomyces verrucosisporus]MBN3930710.1 hypothetical protein [Streptomyces verrucosisporus]
MGAALLRNGEPLLEERPANHREAARKRTASNTAFTIDLPLDRFSLSQEDQILLQRAEIKAQQLCVARFGVPAPKAAEIPRAANSAELTRRYGLLDRRAAEKNGYQIPDSSDPAPDVYPELNEIQHALLSGHEADGGVLKSHRGNPVPEDGCAGEAAHKIRARDKDEQIRMAVARDIDHESYKRSLTNPRVRNSFADWSRCMKGKGFTYESPLTVTSDPRFAEPDPDDKERTVAVADVDCKFSVDLPNVWMNVERKIQRELVEKDKRTLDLLAADQERILKKARALLRAK